MIRHIVLFEFQDADGNFILECKERLEGLADKISEIRSISAAINENPAESYHIALTVDVGNYAELEAYAKHPEHLKAASFLKKKMSKRACVDFTV